MNPTHWPEKWKTCPQGDRIGHFASTGMLVADDEDRPVAWSASGNFRRIAFIRQWLACSADGALDRARWCPLNLTARV